ncbi:MAG: hypothetical protein K0R63_978 [Rickettsiales bacterium]|jgi:hypothetical protein|nr:hypothetical protein [Rickettsiales bacterium]
MKETKNFANLSKAINDQDITTLQKILEDKNILTLLTSKNEYGCYPLAYAAITAKPLSLACLIRNGADVNVGFPRTALACLGLEFAVPKSDKALLKNIVRQLLNAGGVLCEQDLPQLIKYAGPGLPNLHSCTLSNGVNILGLEGKVDVQGLENSFLKSSSTYFQDREEKQKQASFVRKI